METQVKQYKLGGETMYTGTIQSQVSLQMLDLKWQKKKQDINSKKDTEGMTQDEILLDSLERQAQTERERSATSELYTCRFPLGFSCRVCIDIHGGTDI